MAEDPLSQQREHANHHHRLALSGTTGLPGSSLLQINQSAILTAPTAATKLPRYPKKRSPRMSNITYVKAAIKARYEIRKKGFRHPGTPMTCWHFGHGNENGRCFLLPCSLYVPISLQWNRLLQTGHRGTSGINCVTNGHTIYSSTIKTRIGQAMSGGDNALILW